MMTLICVLNITILYCQSSGHLIRKNFDAELILGVQITLENPYH